MSGHVPIQGCPLLRIRRREAALRRAPVRVPARARARDQRRAPVRDRDPVDAAVRPRRQASSGPSGSSGARIRQVREGVLDQLRDASKSAGIAVSTRSSGKLYGSGASRVLPRARGKYLQVRDRVLDQLGNLCLYSTGSSGRVRPQPVQGRVLPRARARVRVPAAGTGSGSAYGFGFGLRLRLQAQPALPLPWQGRCRTSQLQVRIRFLRLRRRTLAGIF